MKFTDSRTQVVLIAISHFCSIGMWNALNSLGSLGTNDTRLASYCNSVMYLSGILGGLVGGSIVNLSGIKTAAIIGLYGQASTLLSYYLYFYRNYLSLTSVVWYSALSSITISSLTSAIGTTLIHYPLDDERPWFIAVSSAILNLGGFFGGILALFFNIDHGESTSLSESSYLFIVSVSFLGLLIGCCLTPQHEVEKSNGSVPVLVEENFRSEFVGLVNELNNIFLWLLLPLFMVNVWHEVIVFGFLNCRIFNIRSRAINTLWYYSARVGSSFIFQFSTKSLTNFRQRVRICLIMMFGMIVLAIGSSSVVFLNCWGLKGFVDSDIKVDFFDCRAWILIFTFLGYGSLETMSSNMIVWLIAELNVGNANSRNRLMGLSRSAINLGGCISWAIDVGDFAGPLTQWLTNIALWVVVFVGIVYATKLHFNSVQNTVTI